MHTVDNNNMGTTLQTAGAGSYISAVLVFFTGLSFENLMALVGLALGIGTFLVNWYYRHQDNQRREELHELELQQRQQEREP